MQLFMFLIDSNTLHVSGVTCPSSGAQETVCAAWCRIQLSLILSFCLSRNVSVQGLVCPGLVCVGCPLGSVHYDVVEFTVFTVWCRSLVSLCTIICCRLWFTRFGVDWQHMIVHNDTSDLHHTVKIVNATTIIAHTTQWTKNAHHSRTHQTLHKYST